MAHLKTKENYRLNKSLASSALSVHCYNALAFSLVSESEIQSSVSFNFSILLVITIGSPLVFVHSTPKRFFPLVQ